MSTHQATSLSSQLSKFEDKKRKHVQTLERKTSNMKQMFKKGKGKITPLLIGLTVACTMIMFLGNFVPNVLALPGTRVALTGH